VYGDGVLAVSATFTLDCIIRDVSDGGAKVVLAKSQLLPPDLYLVVVKYCVAFRARIVWQKFPARGLRFTQTYPLSAGLPDELKFLRKLWGDLYARCGIRGDL
jgi:hypothetical protein